MKKILLLCLLLLPQIFIAQLTTSPSEILLNVHLDSIRHQTAALTMFFQQMPKGGDLHHHFSGSVYTETFVDEAIQQDYWVHRQTLEVRDTLQENSADNNWVRFSALQQEGLLWSIRQKLLRLWSVKDYVQTEVPPDQHFFSTFDYFNPVSRHLLEKGLLELKQRARHENVQYIETMRGGPACPGIGDQLMHYNAILQQLQSARNESATLDTLRSLYRQLWMQGAEQCVLDFVAKSEATHRRLSLDDSTFVLRYQLHALRVEEPVQVFRRLAMCFLAADRSSLIVGVNIVAPEDNPISMRDYWLHMQMFRFFGKVLFPKVKYAMHAGELTLGLVPSEELTWHINAAVRIAGADRIGHGVDLPYEAEPLALLDYMRDHRIVVEVNLTSNEFILRVKDDRHPFLLYKNAGVPIVISTDDAGVLRSNLTEQFVLLANRYSSVTYSAIKQYVYNSIDYSFVEESDVKTNLRALLDRQFSDFEQMICRSRGMKQ